MYVIKIEHPLTSFLTLTMTEPLVLTGNDLTISSLMRAARDSSVCVALHPAAEERMKQNRSFAERVARRGDDVYGLTTGVGMRKSRIISAERMVEFNVRMIDEHATGQGPPIPPDVTRAAAIVLLNTLAKGYSNVRLEVAQKIANRLSDGPPLADVPLYGITGMGDVTPLAHLSRDLLGSLLPAAGEALPLIAQSSFVAAYAAKAVCDARVTVDQCIVMSVLDAEAFAANPSAYHPDAASVRPFDGYEIVIARMNELLKGSRLLVERPRSLQPPLSFRCAASVLGAAYDALQYCEKQVFIELNAHQQNPLAWVAEDRMIPVAHFDMQAVASALDFLRIALVPCLTCQAERSVKLLQKSLTGLTDGLEPWGDEMGHGLSEITWPLQAVTVEAKLLAQPVSFEVGSSYQAEGLEDRMTMASLSARRVQDMLFLAHRALSISAVISCQAIDLRGKERLGQGALDVHRRIRRIIPKLAPGDSPPSSYEELVNFIQHGALTIAPCDKKIPSRL